MIFFSLSWAVRYVRYCGLSNRRSRRTSMAVAALFDASLVFAFNGWRCPRTKVAEGFGAANGTVGGISLPR